MGLKGVVKVDVKAVLFHTQSLTNYNINAPFAHCVLTK